MVRARQTPWHVGPARVTSALGGQVIPSSASITIQTIGATLTPERAFVAQPSAQKITIDTLGSITSGCVCAIFTICRTELAFVICVHKVIHHTGGTGLGIGARGTISWAFCAKVSLGLKVVGRAVDAFCCRGTKRTIGGARLAQARCVSQNRAC
jgi:hypothetical protein